MLTTQLYRNQFIYLNKQDSRKVNVPEMAYGRKAPILDRVTPDSVHINHDTIHYTDQVHYLYDIL